MCSQRGGKAFRDSITMAFQPIFDLHDGAVFAQEALLRGKDGRGAGAVLGALDPDALYGFDQECRATAITLAARLGLTDALSINFLPNAVYEPRTCIQRTLWTADSVNFPIERIIFEFSETEKLRDVDHLRNIVDSYREMGFRTALDDFGAGFAGLGMLAEIRPDIIKLDRALVSGIDADAVRRAILRATAQLCDDLGIVLVVEGVETAAELDVVEGMGLRYVQGFLLARPQFEALQTVPDHPAAAAPRALSPAGR